MAGLYGYLARSTQPSSEVRERLRWMRSFMTSRPSHRFVEHAVDGAGVGNIGTGIFEGTLALHQRPLERDGRTLVVDGEIYHGHTWPLVHEQWISNGAAGIADVDGVYNAVEIDASSAGAPRLSIFNDRYGSRRLYMAHAADAFVFASEMAPLVAWLGDAAAIDEDFVRESLCLGSPYGDRTWIRGITLVPPAIALSVSRDGVRPQRYWQWSSLAPHGTHRGPDRFEVLDGLWQRAMRARLESRGGGRAGQQLSGGLDSRLILGEAVLHRSDWRATTYGERGADDVRFAERAATAASAAWRFLELPGDDWLARRLALSIEHDGIVDVANAHHAGFLDAIAGEMQIEMSGNLGDALMGGTGTDLTPESALSHFGFYASPVSLDLADAHERICTHAAGADSAWIWMFENKWRRATNAWPHMAVNHLEVRKPFMDYALVEHCYGLPLGERVSRDTQTGMLARCYPALAGVPWQKTGVRPSAGPVARAAIKGVRLAYRQLQPLVSRAGLPMRPWLRNACDIGAWCSDPAIQRTLTECLTDRDALIAGCVDRRAVEQTLRMAFANPRQVAIEVPMNLYRAEHMLRRWRDVRRRAAAPRESVAGGR
jgi:hypothetical protein